MRSKVADVSRTWWYLESAHSEETVRYIATKVAPFDVP